MEEIKIIKKLESLKAVKPNEGWVLSAKKMITEKRFEREVPSTTNATFASFNFVSLCRKTAVPTFAAIATLLLGFTFYVAESSLPGDPLYAMKQATENVQVGMMSPKDQSVAKVAQAEERLSELDNITKQSENQGSKLAAGISATQKALSVASKELDNLPDNQKAEMAGVLVKKINQIEKTTNASIIDNKSSDYTELYKSFAETQIQEIEQNESNLTAEQDSLLLSAKESFAVANYSQALDYIYQIQPQTDN